MAHGKRLAPLEFQEDEAATPDDSGAATSNPTTRQPEEPRQKSRESIPLPPIPPAPRREIMVQLSIKAPLVLVERLESLTKSTGAQKQAVLALALEAYLTGHGY